MIDSLKIVKKETIVPTNSFLIESEIQKIKNYFLQKTHIILNVKTFY